MDFVSPFMVLGTIAASGYAAKRLAGFAYDAVVSKGRRKAPDGVLRSEDAELNRSERRKMISGARDIHRNFTIASWAIRKHLDYVTTFNFQGKGKHADWLQAFVKEWSKAKNFDVAGRRRRRNSSGPSTPPLALPEVPRCRKPSVFSTVPWGG